MKINSRILKNSVSNHFCFFFLLNLFLIFSPFQQFTNAQQTFCTTELTTAPPYNPQLHNMEETGPFYIKIYPHIIRMHDGSAGQPVSEVENALTYLQEDFQKHGIYFVRDCGINEINSFFYYNFNRDKFLNLAMDHGHSDGIDIFFLDDNVFNSGTTRTIPSTQIVIGGNYWLPPFQSLMESRVLTHEMGHCLGLYHTHEPVFCEELVNGDEDNCQMCGDQVCDTPADPNLNWDVDQTTCLWNSPTTDSEGTPYTTEEKTNNMAYTHPDCMNGFTEGQGQLMRNTIATDPDLALVLVQTKVTGTETWNTTNIPSGIVEIEGTLILEEGSSLTIGSNISVHFGKESRLVIKPNATLYLDGTLTSLPCTGTCDEQCGDTWKGVEVWGNSAESQYAIGGVRAQGRLVGRTSSLIENAEVGVKLWGGGNPEDNGGYYTHGGGQISCTLTTFKNNSIAVQIAPYQNFLPFPPYQERGYSGTFSESTFETDNTYEGAEPFNTFVRVVGANGIKFLGCTFLNSQTPIATTESTILDYGIGIHTTNSAVKILAKCNGSTYPCTNYTRTTFDGLGYGIHADNPTGMDPYTVKQADFQNCYVGIRNRSVTGATMLFNKFYLGNVPDLALASDQFGIQLESETMGINLEENDFEQVSGNVTNTVGIFVDRLLDHSNAVRKNSFDGIATANHAQNINAHPLGQVPHGLHFLCNENINNVDFDFVVPDVPHYTHDIIREIQGDGVPSSPIAAGNTFSNSASHFFNAGSGSIDYYYDPNVANQIPTSGSINTIIGSSNGCLSTYCEPPCRTKPQIDAIKQLFYQERASFETAKSQYELALTIGNTILADQKKSEAAYHRQEMDKNAFLVLINTRFDTLQYNLDTIRTWMLNLESLGGDVLLAKSYTHTGDFTLAGATLANISNRFQLSTEELNDINDLRNIITLLSQQSIYDLDVSTQAALESIANQPSSMASYMSQEILSLYGKHYPAYYISPSKPKSLTKNTNAPILPTGENLDFEFSVFPNPAKEYTIFSIPSEAIFEKPVLILVRDALGKAIWQSSMQLENYIRWDFEDTPNGIYFYEVRIGEELDQTGKIVISR